MSTMRYSPRRRKNYTARRWFLAFALVVAAVYAAANGCTFDQVYDPSTGTSVTR